ncbi:MAG: response regulator transcription factor [Caldilineaceae bacterium]|nr:response regulator transcription factor [Caldilineaceae bacterium]
MAQHLLVVDDNDQITNLLHQYLQAQGYAVDVAGDGVEALERIADRLPDLILLDVMMPRMDGFEFMQELRRQHAVPVIFLTARLDEVDLLTGFGYGADDYLTKPFSMSELAARVRAVLRRTQDVRDRNEVVRSGDIEVDRARYEVRVKSRPVNLTRTEFSLLEALVDARGRVLSRPQLLEHMFGDVPGEADGFERTVDAHVKNLRAKLAREADGQVFVETVYGVGYRLREGGGL